MKTVRFHLDESMPNGVAEGLRKRDRDCTTTADAELHGASDAEQLEFATREKRVLISRDNDFLVLATNHSDHMGIVYWLQKNHFGQFVKELDAFCFGRDLQQFAGNVFYL